jgi:ribulose-phosphate 3-epimerase
VAINPATPVGALAEIGHMLDIALCMTVNPGWGGQPFIEHSLDKVARSRAILGPQTALEVDGGIDPETAPRCRRAGASVFVAGSAIFDSEDPGGAYRAIARSVEAD